MLYVALLVGSALAAAGQVALKVGATGHTGLLGLINGSVVLGVGLLGAGQMLWLLALTKLPLYVVYPFTLVTLAMVFAASLWILGERPSLLMLGGCAIICVGVLVLGYAIAIEPTSHSA